MRILAVSALWLGSNDLALVSAFRRAGHSVHVVSEDTYFPKWVSHTMRALRRLGLRVLEAEYNHALRQAANAFKPDLLFVFKGTHVWRQTILNIRKSGAIAVQYYPDTGFTDHGKNLTRANCSYDWIFTTKSAHLAELPRRFGIHNISFLPHAVDQDTHENIKLSEKDIRQYGCDVSFIGNVSKKKLRQISLIRDRLDGISLRIWGQARWGKFNTGVTKIYQGHMVTGREFSKAVCASKIDLGLLYEGNSDSKSGDKSTSRSFEIPACGGFMLHERTPEIMNYFIDGQECCMYSNDEELLEKISFYLCNEKERQSIVEAGRERCLTAGYSADDTAAAVVEKYLDLRSSNDVEKATVGAS